MEPNEVYEGTVNDLAEGVGHQLDSDAVCALVGAVGVMLALGLTRFNTEDMPDYLASEVRLKVVNGADGESWSIEITNMDELRGPLQ